MVLFKIKMHVFRIIVLVFMTVQLFLSISCDHEADDSYQELEFTNIDRSNYLDPRDMLNYDRQKIKMTSNEKFELKTQNDNSACKLTNPNMDSGEETGISGAVVSSENSTQLNTEYQKVMNCSVCPKNTTLIEIPFLGRFVKTLKETLKIKDKHIEDNDVLYIPLFAVVNKRTQFILNEITKEGKDIQLKNLADLDEILTNLLILNEEKQDSFDLIKLFSSNFFQLKDLVVPMFVCCLWFVLWLTFKGYSYSYILSRSFLPFFMVSWMWHWLHMYQIVSAKRHSDLSKNMNIPATCNIEQLTLWRTASLYLSTTWLRNPDPCEEYYRVLMTDPSFEINPFVALVDMLAVGIFQPLGFVGSKVGSFFDGVLTSTGVLNKIPVLIAVLITIFMILLMCCSYEIRLPFIKFGPSASLPIPPSETIQNMQYPIGSTQNVKREIENHQAVNVPIGGAKQKYVYQKVTIKRTFSTVQHVEERAQDSIEDCQESSTVLHTPIEELVGNTFSIATNDTNTQKIVEAAEISGGENVERAQDSVEDSAVDILRSISEKKLQLEDSMTSTSDL